MNELKEEIRTETETETVEETVVEGKKEAMIEALLFAADRPLSLAEINVTLGNAIKKAEIAPLLKTLAERYSEEGESGIVLKEVGGGWQFRTNPKYADVIHRFYQKKPRKLSAAALETLAIIAYRQPVTRGEIEEIRGVDSGGVMRALLDRKLVRIIGHKEEAGRPLLYATTQQFLEFIGLNQLSQLPTLEEFMELSEEHRAKIEKEIPEEDKTIKQNIISELIARQFAKAKKEEADVEGEEALSDLNSAMKEMESTFKQVAESVGLKMAPEKLPEGQTTALSEQGDRMGATTERNEEEEEREEELDETEPSEIDEEFSEEKDDN
ncbi:MAG: hypothetical protein Kow0090_20830 [Myxococcota bacterium]